MTFTIGLGWWIAPALVTVLALGWALFMSRDEGSHGDYASIGNAFVALVIYGAALIVSLIAWLVWAVLTWPARC